MIKPGNVGAQMASTLTQVWSTARQDASSLQLRCRAAPWRHSERTRRRTAARATRRREADALRGHDSMNPRLYPLVVLALHTGASVGELPLGARRSCRSAVRHCTRLRTMSAAPCGSSANRWLSSWGRSRFLSSGASGTGASPIAAYGIVTVHAAVFPDSKPSAKTEVGTM